MQETKKYLKEFYYSFSKSKLVFRELLHIHFSVVSIFVDPEPSFSFQRCASRCGGRRCLGGGACTPPTLSSPLTHLPDFSSLTEGLGCTHTLTYTHCTHTHTHTDGASTKGFTLLILSNDWTSQCVLVPNNPLPPKKKKTPKQRTKTIGLCLSC